MDRREFLKKLGTITATGVGAALFSRFENIFSLGHSKSLITPLPYDLVGIVGDLPEKMFDAGIKILGGMQQFVKKGATVLVKPNMGFNRTPEMGATTKPALIARIIEHCLAVGAKKVYVLDHPFGSWQACYKNSGIADAAKNAGGTVVPAHEERYYQKVEIKGAEILKTTEVHELFLEADIVINVPVLKHHGSLGMTSAMKNLMGLVWDRWYYHSNGLDQCVAEFCIPPKPMLNVVDAYTVMLKNGPRGYSQGDLVLKKMQLISTDLVAIDTAAAKIMELDPKNMDYILMAHKLKIGNMNLDSLKIKRIVL